MEEKKAKNGKKKAFIIVALLLAAALIIYLCTALSGSKPADPAESTEPTESTEPVSQDKDPVSSAKPEASEKPEESPAPTESTAPTQTGASSSGSTGSTEHQHNWQAVYMTVHHDEAGHYETVTVQAAWDEQEMRGTYVCNVCGYQGYDADDHILIVHDGAGSYGYIQVPTGKTIHHDAVTEQRWVVDTPAYDEQVITGYKCSCGQEKLA